MCFDYLRTARCIFHFEFLSCLSFLTENSNTIINTAFAQNCVGLDSVRSFGVTVWLRQCHSLVETGKMPSKCIFHYIALYCSLTHSFKFNNSVL